MHHSISMDSQSGPVGASGHYVVKHTHPKAAGGATTLLHYTPGPNHWWCAAVSSLCALRACLCVFGKPAAAHGGGV